MICWRRKYKQCATLPDQLWFITDNESIIGRFLLRHFISPIPLQVVIVLLLLSVLYIFPVLWFHCLLLPVSVLQNVHVLYILVLLINLLDICSYLYLYASYTNCTCTCTLAIPTLHIQSLKSLPRLLCLTGHGSKLKDYKYWNQDLECRSSIFLVNSAEPVSQKIL